MVTFYDKHQKKRKNMHLRRTKPTTRMDPLEVVEFLYPLPDSKRRVNKKGSKRARHVVDLIGIHSNGQELCVKRGFPFSQLPYHMRLRYLNGLCDGSVNDNFDAYKDIPNFVEQKLHEGGIVQIGFKRGGQKFQLWFPQKLFDKVAYLKLAMTPNDYYFALPPGEEFPKDNNVEPLTERLAEYLQQETANMKFNKQKFIRVEKAKRSFFKDRREALPLQVLEKIPGRFLLLKTSLGKNSVRISLGKNSIRTLYEKEWLNDDVFHAFFSYLKATYDVDYIDNNVTRKDFNNEKKQIKLLEDKLKNKENRICLMTLNLAKTHWILLCLHGTKLYIYDGFQNDEYETEKRSFISKLRTVRVIQEEKHHFIYQKDGYNCGVFVCYYAQAIALGALDLDYAYYQIDNYTSDAVSNGRLWIQQVIFDMIEKEKMPTNVKSGEELTVADDGALDLAADED